MIDSEVLSLVISLAAGGLGVRLAVRSFLSRPMVHASPSRDSLQFLDGGPPALSPRPVREELAALATLVAEGQQMTADVEAAIDRLGALEEERAQLQRDFYLKFMVSQQRRVEAAVAGKEQDLVRSRASAAQLLVGGALIGQVPAVLVTVLGLEAGMAASVALTALVVGFLELVARRKWSRYHGSALRRAWRQRGPEPGVPELYEDRYYFRR